MEHYTLNDKHVPHINFKTDEISFFKLNSLNYCKIAVCYK